MIKEDRYCEDCDDYDCNCTYYDECECEYDECDECDECECDKCEVGQALTNNIGKWFTSSLDIPFCVTKRDEDGTWCGYGPSTNWLKERWIKDLTEWRELTSIEILEIYKARMFKIYKGKVFKPIHCNYQFNDCSRFTSFKYSDNIFYAYNEGNEFIIAVEDQWANIIEKHVDVDIKVDTPIYKFNEHDLVIIEGISNNDGWWIEPGEIVKLGGQYWRNDDDNFRSNIDNSETIAAMAYSDPDGGNGGWTGGGMPYTIRHANADEALYYHLVGIGANINSMNKKVMFSNYDETLAIKKEIMQRVEKPILQEISMLDVQER